MKKAATTTPTGGAPANTTTDEGMDPSTIADLLAKYQSRTGVLPSPSERPHDKILGRMFREAIKEHHPHLPLSKVCISLLLSFSPLRFPLFALCEASESVHHYTHHYALRSKRIGLPF